MMILRTARVFYQQYGNRDVEFKLKSICLHFKCYVTLCYLIQAGSESLVLILLTTLCTSWQQTLISVATLTPTVELNPWI